MDNFSSGLDFSPGYRAGNSSPVTHRWALTGLKIPASAEIQPGLKHLSCIRKLVFINIF